MIAQIYLTGSDILIILAWLFQIVTGCGAGYAAFRLWRDRDNQFIRMTMISLHSIMLISLAVVVLLFVSKGVHFTPLFTYTLAIFMTLWNAAKLPLILYVIRGPRESKPPTNDH